MGNLFVTQSYALSTGGCCSINAEIVLEKACCVLYKLRVCVLSMTHQRLPTSVCFSPEDTDELDETLEKRMAIKDAITRAVADQDFEKCMELQKALDAFDRGGTSRSARW